MPITRRPRGTPSWQFGLVGGLGFLGAIYIYQSIYIKSVRDKAENIAEKARQDKSVKNE